MTSYLTKDMMPLTYRSNFLGLNLAKKEICSPTSSIKFRPSRIFGNRSRWKETRSVHFSNTGTFTLSLIRRNSFPISSFLFRVKMSAKIIPNCSRYTALPLSIALAMTVEMPKFRRRRSSSLLSIRNSNQFWGRELFCTSWAGDLIRILSCAPGAAISCINPIDYLLQDREREPTLTVKRGPVSLIWFH